MKSTKYTGIFEDYKRRTRYLFTKSLDGKNFFDERDTKEGNSKYIEFSVKRSKLAAAAIKNISMIPIKENQKILYLGAGHGYTPVHISDIIRNGEIFCVDIAPRVVRDLYFICEERKNMIPILADSNKPEQYENRIEKVDVIYQDIAQKNQVEILFKNLKFLKDKGYVLIAIKSRSIDVTQVPKKIYYEVKTQLATKLKIIDFKELDPFERDHCFFVCQKI
ncbi:MAG: fibrillarin-like rRNA/tRNA 2'-O-methyltransferase [Candidatus Nanoarchaeia archaeon]|nr:fibrillarin-like rRNA/tRNA 2'-O-methyltransferase [Candidatus Nanoarchaeia archaeon]MDD5588121.1 fibrillarin-like rRNA/tRNA 2'-O-methyltransferase [Candidatus Nanoarchaeia archaeon]